ncbi:MAG: nucleotide exchange factor GrpE [Acidobacteriota bacterium]
MSKALEPWKEELLRDFRAWLEAGPASTEPQATEGGNRLPDLHSLFSELAALRQELRLQNREQLRATRELQQARESFAGGPSRRDVRPASEAGNSLAVLDALLPFLDIRDAISRGLANTAAAVSRADRENLPGPDLLEAILLGQRLALERCDRALARAGIVPVQALGRRFDPNSMEAVETRDSKGASPGTVVEEVRGGFKQGDKVIRPARVIVTAMR